MGRTKGDPTRHRLGQIVRAVVSLGLAAAIFAYVLGSAADFSDVRTAIFSMTGMELATLGLAAVWNLVTYWRVVVAATPGLTYPQAMVLVESTTAVANAVPGGAQSQWVSRTACSAPGGSPGRGARSR